MSPIPSATPQPSPGDPAAPVTVLVVDDTQPNRDVLRRRLERVGYLVLAADSGPAALAIAECQRVDLVLLDIMMPLMDGIETLRRLRQARGVSELPVIMVTADDSGERVREAFNAGANDYLLKPIDFVLVQARIRTQLAHATRVPPPA